MVVASAAYQHSRVTARCRPALRWPACIAFPCSAPWMAGVGLVARIAGEEERREADVVDVEAVFHVQVVPG
jgi:hypothetical protein